VPAVPAAERDRRCGRGVLGPTSDGGIAVRATIWGCRGTQASPGPEPTNYGGQTSCIVLDLDDGSVVILDAGTGIRPYGISLAGAHPSRVALLITHLHADLIEGLRFFAPFWNPDVEFHIWGPP